MPWDKKANKIGLWPQEFHCLAKETDRWIRIHRARCRDHEKLLQKYRRETSEITGGDRRLPEEGASEQGFENQIGNRKGPSMTCPNYKSRGWQHTPKDHLLNYIISLSVLLNQTLPFHSALFSQSCPWRHLEQLLQMPGIKMLH